MRGDFEEAGCQERPCIRFHAASGLTDLDGVPANIRVERDPEPRAALIDAARAISSSQAASLTGSKRRTPPISSAPGYRFRLTVLSDTFSHFATSATLSSGEVSERDRIYSTSVAGPMSVSSNERCIRSVTTIWPDPIGAVFGFTPRHAAAEACSAYSEYQ